MSRANVGLYARVYILCRVGEHRVLIIQPAGTTRAISGGGSDLIRARTVYRNTSAALCDSGHVRTATSRRASIKLFIVFHDDLQSSFASFARMIMYTHQLWRNTRICDRSDEILHLYIHVYIYLYMCVYSNIQLLFAPNFEFVVPIICDISKLHRIITIL